MHEMRGMPSLVMVRSVPGNKLQPQHKNHPMSHCIILLFFSMMHKVLLAHPLSNSSVTLGRGPSSAIYTWVRRRLGRRLLKKG